MQKNEKIRLDYLDQLKGFLILWVVWCHTLHPEWTTAYFQVPLFFMLSGFFFKTGDSFGSYVKKKTNQLLVPFFFFYLFGLLYISAYHLLNGTLSEFLSVELLYSWALPQILPFNVPIWFLFTLYLISLICYPIMKWVKSPWIGVGIPMIISYLFIATYPNKLLPMQGSFVIQWLPFVLFGFYFGRKILKVMEGKKIANIIGWGSVAVMGITMLYTTDNSYLGIPVYYLRIFLFGGILFYIFRYLLPTSRLGVLTYYGVNSMVLLGIQSFILNVLLVTVRPRLPLEPNEWVGLGEAFVCCVIAVPVINLMNKYIPQWIGRTPLLR